MQYTVKKPINNNILRVVDPTGCELIVTGRGLGFGVKPGYKIEAETVERSYRMTSPAVQQKLVELLEQIPYEHLLLTDELVAMIRSRVNYPLNESLLITLADHISFAKAISRRTSYLRVRLEFLPYPHLITTLFNGCVFGPPLPLTAASTWTWIDHPVSGL